MLHGNEWRDNYKSVGKDVAMSYVKTTPRVYLVALGETHGKSTVRKTGVQHGSFQIIKNE
jgi:hypothetical protein